MHTLGPAILSFIERLFSLWKLFYHIPLSFLTRGSTVQWNPSKADNLEPHISSIIVGCPLWRGCIDVNLKQSGPRNLSVILKCLL